MRARVTESRSKSRGSVTILALLLLTAGALVSCGQNSTAAGDRFEPVTAGVLTVATAEIPAPGFWLASPTGKYRGFEAELVAELADRLAVDTVRVRQVPFVDLIAGRLRGADVAVSQLTPTAERRKVLAFSTPYISATPAVLVRKGLNASDAAALAGLRWTALKGSTLTEALEDRIDPDQRPKIERSRAAMLGAIRSGTADAALLDLPVALALARVEPDTFEVAGQLSGDEGLAAALPRRSGNLDAVDSALKAMKADGTIDELSQKWFGGGGQDVPLIRVTD